MEHLQEEMRSAERLKALLGAHGLEQYRLEDGRLVELVTSEVKVKVRKPKADAEAAE
jgi:hypothetical protein